MKKSTVILILAVLLIATLLPGCGGDSVPNTGITLEVYNWGEYISDGADDSIDVIAEFEIKTGISVHYTNFASNEEMHTKIAEGGIQYDVIIPSDYMIGQMISAGMLEKLNFDNIPNYKYIGDEYKHLDYDPGNEYSVPYMSGIVGIIYNKTKVTGPVDSWDILWDEQYAGEILMFNNPRDAFCIALLRRGYSVNTTNPDEIAEAAQDLKEQKRLIQAYVMDEIFNKMGGGEAALAPYYAGDAITMMAENPDLAFAVPKEGTNYFVDAMVIPKGCRNKAAAEMFINYMCEPEVSAANAEYIGYSTPIEEARDMLDLDDEEMAIAYPDDDILENTEIYKNLPQSTNELMSQYWIDIKSYEENANQWIMPVLLAIAFVSSIVIMIRRSRKNKRDVY